MKPRMEAWQAISTSASFIGRSSAAQKRFASARPSRSDGPARRAIGKETPERLTPRKGGAEFGGRID